jgi:hypothetical protein
MRCFADVHPSLFSIGSRLYGNKDPHQHLFTPEISSTSDVGELKATEALPTNSSSREFRFIFGRKR